MASLEQLEMARYNKELDDDLQHLLNKYCRIMGWEVPELDERAARSLILEAMRKSLDKLN